MEDYLHITPLMIMFRNSQEWKNFIKEVEEQGAKEFCIEEMYPNNEQTWKVTISVERNK